MQNNCLPAPAQGSVDLTHALYGGMPVYPGDPPVSLEQLAACPRQGYALTRLSLGLHAGTHVDAPAHMIEGGATIDAYPPARFMGRASLLDARGRAAIDFPQTALTPGRILLILTGWDARFGQQDYHDAHPVLSKDFARRIVSCQIPLVGIDMPSPDHDPHPVHRILLGAGIPIVENLTRLDRLAHLSEIFFCALPLPLAAEASPLRALAWGV